MTDVLRYGGIVFDGSLLSARLDDRTEIRFTRAERAVLSLFTRHPGALLTRNQLLDAIDGEGSDSSDRRIDFIINRLRAKLGDPARAPRLIETRYGEGYVWIADRARPELPRRTLLLIGPVFGLDSRVETSLAHRFLGYLQAAFVRRAARDQAVVLMPSGGPGGEHPAGLQFLLKASFHMRAGTWHCAALLRDAQDRRIIAAERLEFSDDSEALGRAEALVETLNAAMWRHSTRAGDAPVAPDEVPLHLKMHDAGRRFAEPDRSWVEMEAQLRAAGAEHSDDPELSLMWGMHLYARLLFEGGAGGMTAAEREAMSNEIERRALASLPHFSGRPLLALAVAKLLFFFGRGHDELAEEIAELAFAQSTAFAASFAMIGQIHLYRGDARGAIELFDRGIEMAERGSQFHLYLLTFRLTAEIAGGDEAAGRRSFAELCALNPRSLFDVGAFVAESRDDGMHPAVQALFDQFDRERVRNAVAYLYFIQGRHFRDEAQRERIMAGIVHHAQRRFGIEAVPEEVRLAVPHLVARR